MPAKAPISAPPAKGSANGHRFSENDRRKLRAENKVLTADNQRLRHSVLTMEGDANDLASLLTSADVALVYVDTRFRLRGFTPAMADLLEVEVGDLGTSFQRLKRKFHDKALAADLRAVQADQIPREAEVVSDSGRAYVRRALPYKLAGGFGGVVLTFVDITRRKLAETALRSSEERHRLILESVAEYAILILDPEGRLLTWTAQAERILGYTPEEAIGQSIEIIYPYVEQENGSVQRELAAARHLGSFSSERWHCRKDGTRFWATEVLSSLHNEAGRMYGFVKVLRDHTERKAVEENLRRAKHEADLANAAKDTFLANVSHELRTPLSATLLWAKLLTATGPATPTPQQIREGLEAVLKSALEQQALIEDLMDSSRIVAGKLRLEPREFDLAALAIGAVENVRPLASTKEVNLTATIDPKAGNVQADPLRLQQVLGNLLNNAIKFTPPGGQVALRLERQGVLVKISVTDTGQGISADFLPRIFDRFTQADNSTEAVNSGLGLGLSIARQLVELHGGTITVQSDGLAKGATFSVRLPLARIAPARDTTSVRPAKAPSLRGLEILLVETCPRRAKLSRQC